MIQMRAAAPADLARLTQLWGLAFGDGPRFVADFFQRVCPPERALVLVRDDQVQAMLVLMPSRLEDGRGLEYVYALTTHPDARGEGYGRALLDYADYWARRHGAQGLSTVPAEPSLHAFFASAGFQEAFATQVWEGEAGGLPRQAGWRAQRLDAAAYGELREELLSAVPHVIYPPEQLAFQESFSAASGGGLFRLEGPRGLACAAAEGREGAVVVKELLSSSPEAALPAAGALAAALPARRYELRGPQALFPPELGRSIPLGMVRWPGAGGCCTPSAVPFQTPELHSYMGLAFD